MGALVNRPLLPGSSNPFPEASHLTRPNDTMLGLLSAKHITSFVIDAEVVALDKDTGAFRTFQDLSNRAKKDVRVEDIKVIVGVFSFDLMLLNDEVSLSRVRGTLTRIKLIRSGFLSCSHCSVSRFQYEDIYCGPFSNRSLMNSILLSHDLDTLSQ
jgi:hypothetical protein